MSGAIPCPACQGRTSKVIDSRSGEEPIDNVRRRRLCACGHRYTTVELVADTRFGSLLDVSALPRPVRKPLRDLVAALNREGVPTHG